MASARANRYLRTQVQTANKEQLLIMLFDGAIRFAEQARVHLAEGRFEQSCNLLVQAERIIVELMGTLQPEGIDEKLYDNLLGLYNFCYQKFISANLHSDVEAIGEAIPILIHLRDTWSEAIKKLAGGGELPNLTAHPNSNGLCIEG